MLRFLMRDQEPEIIAESEGVAVYLDNDSISNLATGAQSRRERFADALQRGRTLLFSWMNAVELWSSDAVRVFLDSIGPAWIPVEMNPWILVQREADGFAERTPIAESFMRAYFQERSWELSPGDNRVLDLSAETFFRLGRVVDWAREERKRQIHTSAPEMDSLLRDTLIRFRFQDETIYD